MGARSRRDHGKYPEFSVAVAGFSGLDLARPTVDATFDFTIRIKEPRRYSAACIERGAVAAVSYSGVPLAQGPVPAFCGKNENTTEARSVMAWGYAAPVPQFARDRLAEEMRRPRGGGRDPDVAGDGLPELQSDGDRVQASPDQRRDLSAVRGDHSLADLARQPRCGISVQAAEETPQVLR
ncbi:hypothetical protein ABZP36_023241 [Zizania latifolia]